jgi:predicted RNase H-like HicB family nuclease
MSNIKHSVQVKIAHFSGQEEGDVGHPYYVASCDDLMFTTDGETFEELLRNIGECLVLCLHDTDSVAEYGVAHDARVKLVMELTQNYAQIA